MGLGQCLELQMFWQTFYRHLLRMTIFIHNLRHLLKTCTKLNSSLRTKNSHLLFFWLVLLTKNSCYLSASSRLDSFESEIHVDQAPMCTPYVRQNTLNYWLLLLGAGLVQIPNSLSILYPQHHNSLWLIP